MNILNLARAGWLDDITNWIGRQLGKLWDAFIEWTQDAFLWFLESTLDFWCSLIEAIPAPDFLANGLGPIFAQMSPEILYFVGLFRIPEGMAMLAAAVTFRLLRKLFTLGQW